MNVEAIGFALLIMLVSVPLVGVLATVLLAFSGWVAFKDLPEQRPQAETR